VESPNFDKEATPCRLRLVITVSDKRIQNIPEVVLVRRGAVGFLGVWEGGELGELWGKWGQFTSNLRPRWTIPVTTGGFQVSRRGLKGKERGGSKGRLNARERAMYKCISNSCQCIYLNG
jgi:hypothetical protein